MSSPLLTITLNLEKVRKGTKGVDKNRADRTDTHDSTSTLVDSVGLPVNSVPGVELDTGPDAHGAGARSFLIRCLVSTTILHRCFFRIYGKDLLLTFWRHLWDGWKFGCWKAQIMRLFPAEERAEDGGK